MKMWEFLIEHGDKVRLPGIIREMEAEIERLRKIEAAAKALVDAPGYVLSPDRLEALANALIQK